MYLAVAGAAPGNLQSGYAWQLDVQNDERWVVDIGQVKRVVPADCLSYHGKSGVLFDDPAQAVSKQGVIVDDEYPAFEHHKHLPG